MIEGIEVLNTNKCIDVPDIVYILGLFAIISILLAFINAIIGEEFATLVGVICFLVLGTIITCIIVMNTLSYHYEYQVTISDEVNFNDFNKKYEIINQEGLIYTIKEKEEKDENKKN